MKVKLLIFGLVALIGAFGISMMTAGDEVPQAVKKAFSKKFPKAQKVKWELEEEGVYEAEFKMTNKKMSANFKTDGSWLETETEMKGSDLPAAVKTAIATMFPGYELEEADQVEKPDAELTYEVELEDEQTDTEVEALFNAKGDLLTKNVNDDDDDDEGDDEDEDGNGDDDDNQ